MVLSDCAPWQSNHSTRRGEVHRNKIEISAGVIELSLSKKKEINGPVLAAEILIDPVLLSKKRKAVNFKPFSTFPPAMKDLALLADQDEPAEKVRSALEAIALEVADHQFLVDPVTIFDLFSGSGLPDGKKSVACGMRFRSNDRTLGEEEVNRAFEQIVEKIEQMTPYSLRT